MGSNPGRKLSLLGFAHPVEESPFQVQGAIKKAALTRGQVAIILLACGPCVAILNCLEQVLYLGRAPRTMETLPYFREWCRVTRHPLVFRRLTGYQRTPRSWGVTSGRLTSSQLTSGRLTFGQLTSGRLTSRQLTSGQLTYSRLTSSQLTSS